ncbi:MAG: hypothetical protein R6V73_12100 [Anaerolineales bacterium]
MMWTLPSDDVPIIYIGAVFLRLMGETLAILLGVIGFGGAVLVWFTGARTAWGLLPFLIMPVSRPFVAGDPVSVLLTGMATLVIYTFLAAVCLLGHYLLAEVIIIFKGIYRNTQLRGEAKRGVSDEERCSRRAAGTQRKTKSISARLRVSFVVF